MVNQVICKKKRIKSIKLFLIAAAIALVLLSLGLSIAVNKLIIIMIIIPLVLFFIILNLIKKDKCLSKMLKYLYFSNNDKISEVNFSKLDGSFNYISESDQVIDNKTFDDLELKKFYQTINKTFTTPGENLLYSFIKIPLYKLEKLKKRYHDIFVIKKDSELMQNLSFLLMNIGKNPSHSLIDFLCRKEKPSNKFKFIIILFFYTIFSIVLLFIPPIILFSLPNLLIILIINIVFYNKNYYLIEKDIEAVNYLLKILKSYKQINNAIQTKLYFKINIHEKILDKIKFHLKVLSADQDSFDAFTKLILLYFKVFLLTDFIFYISIKKHIEKYKREFTEIYKFIGELDSYLSVAFFLNKYKGPYCNPDISQEKKIVATDIYNPLIVNPVNNSVTINNNGLIITGTNMAGKSTFLRTIGINVILSQTLYICFSKSFKTSFFRIFTSINKKDSLFEGKSYYYYEAERIYEIIKMNYDDIPHLFLIDELLSGTNSVERIAASISILNYFISKNILIVAATHDTQIAKMLKSNYQCYFFTDRISNGDLFFDYKLKDGIVNTTNALKLLEKIGYPKTIINNALKDI